MNTSPLRRKSQLFPLQPVQQTNVPGIFPAPVKGLDVSASLVNMDPATGIVLTNHWCRRRGVELRYGYQRWNTNLGGVGTESEVVTMMPYYPPRGTGSALIPKLFAACANGNIYDVTDQQDEAFVPAVAVNISGQLDVGRFSWVNISVAGVTYLCIVSAGGGYWTYDDAGGWVNRTANVTGTGGANVNFDFILLWKRRLWFIENNSTSAWYLGVDAIQGTATEFDFGPLFLHGGELEAMASWTLDAGDGLDDKLVVVGQAGDLIVYQGIDPSSATTFLMIGRWYIGQVPVGRRFMSQYGGDLQIVTENGVERMSLLTADRGLLSPNPHDILSDRYLEAVSRDVRATRGQRFWQLIPLPSEESTILITPHKTVGDGRQYARSFWGQAWSWHVGMPVACATVFLGDLYFGTLDGKVCKAYAGNSDDELSDGTPGATLQGEIQTAFVTVGGDPHQMKRPLMVMPMFQAPSAPQVKIQVNTEWSTSKVPGSPVYVSPNGAIWNSSQWNNAVWGGLDGTYFAWGGCEGLGVYASLRMLVSGLPKTTFTSWKIVEEPGGLM